MPTPDGLAQVGGAIVLLAAVFTAFGVIGRKLWRFIRGVARVYSLSHEAFETIVGTENRQGIDARLGRVESELRPNGGGSLRDAVDGGRSEAQRAVEAARKAVAAAEVAAEGTARLEQGQADHAERLTDIGRQVDANSKRITDHRQRQAETVERLEAYIRGERDDHIEAIKGLEASVTELLQTPDPPERQLGDD